MVHFQSIDKNTFLRDYWQKKPLLIRQALPDFINPISADELAGLALEEDIESRVVIETPGKAPFWTLKRGPFTEKFFTQLPKTHWTLLVQSVDLYVPDVAALVAQFDFIPQWRFDDVMISYAVKHGSVGPHYDNYDVFLYQARGQRKWSLTTKHCHVNNCLKGTDLRIMSQFEVEEEYVLSAGDMLYLPPHVGHYGISLDDECMTYSFGYRSYQGQELWDSFGEYMHDHAKTTLLYQDPNWTGILGFSEIPVSASRVAKEMMQNMLENEQGLQSWFGCFSTQIDAQTEQHLPLPLEEDEQGTLSLFVETLLNTNGLQRHPACRFAYQYLDDKKFMLRLFINGCEWDTQHVSSDLMVNVANERTIEINNLKPFLKGVPNQNFLYELWKLQWLEFIE